MQLNALGKSALALALCAPLFAHAEFGIYAKGGTMGLGGGIGYGITETISGRLGYTTYDYDLDIETDDVDYDATIKLGGGEAMLDWHPFSGSFRLTGGVIFSRNKVDVDAKANKPVRINGVTYQASQLGSLTGEAEFKSTVPYLGIGWGNVAGKNGNFHFVADIGVLFQGEPDVTLHGSCTPAFQSNPNCQVLLNNVAQEEKELEDEVSDYKVWPVLNIGVAYRF